MQITKLYERYEIPPWLADHQLTVAGVASVVCTATGKGERDAVVTACLLHDMGNIIKFDLDRKLPGIEVDDIAHWKEVQQRFIATYGTDVHAATLAIVDEIGVSARVREVLDAVGFRNAVSTLASSDISKMIAAYSDMRVAPYGVATLKERLDEGCRRYGESADREQFEQAFREMEQIIFSDTERTPSAVTQAAVDEEKSELLGAEI